MNFLLIGLAPIAGWGVIATVIAVARDGYCRTPPRDFRRHYIFVSNDYLSVMTRHKASRQTSPGEMMTTGARQLYSTGSGGSCGR